MDTVKFNVWQATTHASVGSHNTTVCLWSTFFLWPLTNYLRRRQYTWIIDSDLVPSDSFCGNFYVLRRSCATPPPPHPPHPPHPPVCKWIHFRLLKWQITAWKFSCRSIFKKSRQMLWCHDGTSKVKEDHIFSVVVKFAADGWGGGGGRRSFQTTTKRAWPSSLFLFHGFGNTTALRICSYLAILL